MIHTRAVQFRIRREKWLTFSELNSEIQALNTKRLKSQGTGWLGTAKFWLVSRVVSKKPEKFLGSRSGKTYPTVPDNFLVQIENDGEPRRGEVSSLAMETLGYSFACSCKEAKMSVSSKEPHPPPAGSNIDHICEVEGFCSLPIEVWNMVIKIWPRLVGKYLGEKETK